MRNSDFETSIDFLDLAGNLMEKISDQSLNKNFMIFLSVDLNIALMVIGSM